MLPGAHQPRAQRASGTGRPARAARLSARTWRWLTARGTGRISHPRVDAHGVTTLRAVVYSRISSDPLEPALGVERQEQDCLRLINERGWVQAVEPYRENDTSASTRSRTKRPVYEAMLADLRAGMADVLVAADLDRCRSWRPNGAAPTTRLEPPPARAMSVPRLRPAAVRAGTESARDRERAPGHATAA